MTEYNVSSHFVFQMFIRGTTYEWNVDVLNRTGKLD